VTEKSKAIFPEEQRDNLTRQLSLALQRKLEEDDISFDRAFSLVALQILGFEVDSGVMADGRGDFGIDFYIVEERAATVFQFKSHDFTEGLNPNFVADSKYLSDLPRIENLIENLDDVPSAANPKIKEFIKELRSAIHRYNLTRHSNESPFELSVFFCCLAKSFTAQAQIEFQRLSETKVLIAGGQKIRVTVVPFFIDDLIAERWRESNTDWRTSSGKREDRIEFDVRGGMIASAKSLAFFTSAFDLVTAFDTFGYQMFEPNCLIHL
jgi:hypothetical protein